jgi:hypothetical protein
MLLHDIRLAARQLGRRPGFALTAILLLALGAGANAAVFSVVRGVLLRPLPFARPAELVAVWPGAFVSNEEIGVWRDRARSLAAVASMAPGWLMALVAEGGEPLKVTGARVSDNFFTTLGTPAALQQSRLPQRTRPVLAYRFRLAGAGRKAQSLSPLQDKRRRSGHPLHS